MNVLHYVPATEVTDGDWEALRRADQSGPLVDRISDEEIQRGLGTGEMMLFRFIPGPGVLLTATNGKFGVKRLVLLRAAGHGVGWTFPQLADLLVKTAKEWGCEAIESMVYSQRLATAMQKVGAFPEAVRMVLKVE